MNRHLDLIICPKTKQPLEIDFRKGIAISSDNQIKYPIIDGILDLCPAEDEKQYITQSYDAVAPSYDRLLTSSTLFTRLYNKTVWGLYDGDYVGKLLSFFPDAAGKIILDVPVGTGVFTCEMYQRIAQSSRSIIVLDYSLGMLRRAKERYERNGIDNIIYVRGDIGNLPLPDGCVDILLTMNGYHAFPEKEKALSEMARVTHPGSALLGCFYIQGERALTDFVARKIYSRLGSFTPPFYGFAENKAKWSRFFEFQHYRHVKSILYFAAVKRNPGGEGGR